MSSSYIDNTKQFPEGIASKEKRVDLEDMCGVRYRGTRKFG